MRLRERIGAMLLGKRWSLSNPPDWVIDGMMGPTATSGVPVNEKTALNLSAAYACISRIAREVGRIPLKVYRKTGQGREEASDHPVYRIVHDTPNSRMSAFHWKQHLMFEVLTGGNHLEERVYDGKNRLIYVNPIPWRTVLKVESLPNNSGKRFQIRLGSGGMMVATTDRVTHFRGLSSDGVLGLSPIEVARHSIGKAIASRDFSARFWKNNAIPGFGVGFEPGVRMDVDSRAELKADLKRKYSGENVFEPFVGIPGMKILEIPKIPLQDLQFIEGENFSVQDVCRFFDMSPFQIGSTDKSSFNNLSQDSKSYLDRTLDPWLVNLEQEITSSFFTNIEREQGYYVEFVRDAILHIDAQAKTESYREGIFGGWLTLNDIRKRNNMPPYPAEIGDVPFMQTAMAPVTAVVGGTETIEATPMRSEEEGTHECECCGDNHSQVRRIDDMDGWHEIRAEGRGSSRERLAIRQAYRGMFASGFDRMNQRLAADISKNSTKLLTGTGSAAFLDWLEQYFEEQRGYMEKVFGPIFGAMADAILDSASKQVDGVLQQEKTDLAKNQYLDRFVSRTVGSKRGQIAKIARESEPDRVIDDIDVRLNEWPEHDRKTVADETNQLEGFMTKTAFTLAGVTTLVWNANEGACPYCQEMDGRVSAIKEEFVIKDGTVDAEDGKMTTSRNINHPPLHGGCECWLAPG